MKLSTRARYGIHAMVDLAEHCGMGPQSIKDIAQRQGIPEQYLEQLMALLRREGFVKSFRGAQGGYLLDMEPVEITMGALMNVLEGPISFAQCLDDEGACDKACACPSRRVWERLSQSIDDVLYSVTLKDMIEDKERLTTQGRDNA